jgi:hypothetical protein
MESGDTLVGMMNGKSYYDATRNDGYGQSITYRFNRNTT